MAGIADELKRIPMSEALAATLARAADYARAQAQGEVALEHLLLALTEDDDAAQVLSASHVDTALLKADVSQYLGGLDFQEPSARPGHITLAVDLKRILEAAAAAASQGRRREINGAIVLAAIVGDGRSSAAHMLRAQGLTFEEAIKALQQALALAPKSGVVVMVPPKTDGSKTGSLKPEAEDVIASARARVQTRAVPGMPPLVVKAERPPELLPPSDLDAPHSPAGVSIAYAEPSQTLPVVSARAESGVAVWPPPVRSSLAAVPDPKRGDDVDRNGRALGASGYEPGMHDADGLEDVPHEQAGFRASARDGLEETDFSDANGALLFDRALANAQGEPYSSAESVARHASYVGEPTIQTPTSHAPHASVISQHAHLPQPAGPPRSRPVAPLPGTRWPAPVAPAWRDQEVSLPSLIAPAVPPPLPQLPVANSAASPVVPLPPPLPRGHDAGGRETRNGGISIDAADLDGHNGTAWPKAYAPHSGDFSDEHSRVGPDVTWPNADTDADALANSAYLSTEADDVGTSAAWMPADPQGDWQAEAYQHGPSVAADPAIVLPALRLVKRRKSVERAASGHMSETIPRRMRTGVASLVEIRLETVDFRQLADGLQGEDSTTRPPALAAAMSVTLSAPDGGFHIALASPQTQWLEVVANPSVQDFASWHWAVTPVKAGNRRLQMAISVRTLAADGTPTVSTLPDQAVQISVRRSYGRGLLKLMGWSLLVLVGWFIAKYGDAVLNPLIAEVLNAVK